MSEPSPSTEAGRWELYRLLSEPLRLRLLALAAEEELAIGELAELLGEGQPHVSRQVGALRKAGLVSVRKQGTRSFARAGGPVQSDPVVADGLAAGRRLCERDGSLARVAQIVSAREVSAREYFSREHARTGPPDAVAQELPAYLSVVGGLLGRFALAVDIGTGDGALLDAIAPLSERVIAVDRERVQLDRARARARARGYGHVELLCESYDGTELARRVRDLGGAQVVFAARVLHHAPKPREALALMASLLRPGGSLVVIDYVNHEDEGFREQQADLWMGFEAQELLGWAHAAGLCAARVLPIERGCGGAGPNKPPSWQALVARAEGEPNEELARISPEDAQ